MCLKASGLGSPDSSTMTTVCSEMEHIHVSRTRERRASSSPTSSSMINGSFAHAQYDFMVNTRVSVNRHLGNRHIDVQERAMSMVCDEIQFVDEKPPEKILQDDHPYSRPNMHTENAELNFYVGEKKRRQKLESRRRRYREYQIYYYGTPQEQCEKKYACMLVIHTTGW